MNLEFRKWARVPIICLTHRSGLNVSTAMISTSMISTVMISTAMISTAMISTAMISTAMMSMAMIGTRAHFRNSRFIAQSIAWGSEESY